MSSTCATRIRWSSGLDQGHTTFIISWVNPDEKMARTSFEDYLLKGTLEAITQVCNQTGEDSVNLAAYCIGGTLTMTTLAYMAAKKDKRVNSATFFTTMLDFSEPGEMSVFLDEGTIEGLEKKMAKRGFLEGSEMAGTFNMLRANDLIWSFRGQQLPDGQGSLPRSTCSTGTRTPPACRRRCTASTCATCTSATSSRSRAALPWAASRSTSPRSRRRATSSRPSKTTLPRGRAPTWAPPPSGPTKFVLGGSGHIAGIVNPPAANKYGYWTNDATDGNLPESPDDFLAGATQHAGSWWTHWHSG